MNKDSRGGWVGALQETSGCPLEGAKQSQRAKWFDFREEEEEELETERLGPFFGE